jgi:hypothetical protein
VSSEDERDRAKNGTGGNEQKPEESERNQKLVMRVRPGSGDTCDNTSGEQDETPLRYAAPKRNPPEKSPLNNAAKETQNDRNGEESN